MVYIIVCEGKTDAFIINLILTQDGFVYTNKKNGPTFKLLKKQSLDYFIKGKDTLVIWNVGGCGNIKDAINKVKLLAEYETTPIDSLGIVIDKDFNDGSNIENEFTELFKLETPLKNTVWNTHKYTTSFENEKELKILLNIIPYGEFGALETIMFTSLKDKGGDEKKLAENIEKMIEKLKEEGNSYFEKERYAIKAKLGCLINIIDPERTFYDIIESFSEIDWASEPIIETHFKQLKKYN